MSKRRLMIAIYVIVIASIFCICGSLSAIASNNAKSSEDDGINESVGRIGDTQYTSDWQIVLNSVARRSGNILVSITVKNISVDVQYIPSIGNFNLTDRSNKKYDSVDTPIAQDTIETGISVNETLVYKVSGNSTTFHLDFNPDIMKNDDSVGFDFTIK